MSSDSPDQPRYSRRPEPVAADPIARSTNTPTGARRIPGQRSVPVRRRDRAPLPVAAAVATGWAALLSYLPVAVILGVARSAGNDGLGDALRLGLASWLLGHGVPLETTTGRLGLPPLALTLLAAWRVARAGVHVSRVIGARQRGTPRQLFLTAGAVGFGYGLLGLLGAALLAEGQLVVSPVQAGLRLALFGALAALVGVLSATNVLAVLTARIPVVVRDGLHTGLVAALLLLAAGAGAAGLSVATAGGEASDMLGAYRTGVAGQVGLTLICLGYLPNAAVWAVSYLLGPGFAVGTDTVVRINEVTVGALPAVPLLAGLPHGPIEGIGVALLAVPLLTGMIAGWLLARRLCQVTARERVLPGWRPLLASAALGGPVAGIVLGFVATYSAGPFGSGRLAEIGPVGWQVSVVATLVVAAGALVGAAAARAVTTDPANPRRTGRPGR